MAQVATEGGGDVIEFPQQLNAQCEAVLHLANTSDELVTFKIEVNAPKKYLVRPNKGLIKPGDSAEVRVILQPLTDLVPPGQHFILFNATNVPDGTLQMTAQDWARFVKERKDQVQEQLLGVVFVEKDEEEAEEEGSEVAPEEVSRGLTRDIPRSGSSTKKPSDTDEAVSTMADDDVVWSFGQTGGSAQARRERRRDVVAKSVRSGKTPKTDDAPKCTVPLNLALDETTLFTFVHKVNEVYQRYLHKSMPFVRYILLGMQSSGKSSIVERLIGFPLNFVAEGTGTRCPLYITCIDDKDVISPECELTGCEQCEIEGTTITEVADVFKQVTKHHREYVGAGFSCEPIRLKVRSNMGSNVLFVDLPGIITTKTVDVKDNRESIKKIIRKEMSNKYYGVYPKD